MPETNSTPKQRYQDSGDNVGKHLDLVGSKEFERAIDFALLNYLCRLGEVAGAHEGAAPHVAGLKLQGAHEFILELKTLADKPKALSARNIVGLDHNQ